MAEVNARSAPELEAVVYCDRCQRESTARVTPGETNTGKPFFAGVCPHCGAAVYALREALPGAAGKARPLS